MASDREPQEKEPVAEQRQPASSATERPRSTDALAAVSRLQAALAAPLDQQSIGAIAGDTLRELFDAQVVELAAYDRGTGQLRGLYTWEHGVRLPARPLELTGFYRQVIETGELAVINQVVRESTTRAALPLPRSAQAAQSLLILPLIMGGEAVGVVALHNLEREQAFSTWDIHLLTIIGSALSLALDNARLRAETEQQAQELTTMIEIGREISATLDLATVLERLAARAMQLLRAQDVVVRLLEPDGRLSPAAAVGEHAAIYKDWAGHVGRGLSGSVAQTGRAEIINAPEADRRVIGVAGIEEGPAKRALLVAPLLLGEAVIGVLSVWRDKSSAGAFTPADLEFSIGLARQAAIAIQNARLYTAAQQRARETEILRAANVALTQTFDPDAILGTLLDYLQQVVPYDTGSVFLLEDGHYLTAVATRGYEQWVSNPAQAIGVRFEFTHMPHMRAVVEDQVTFVIPDVTQFAGWIVAETAGHIRNWLAVPLVAAGQTIGMYSLDKVEPGYFTPEHQRLAEALATQAAIAIQNATLFKNQRVAREQAETLTAAAQALSSTLSRRQVFELILSELRKVVPYDSCSVQQLDGDSMVIVGGHGFPNLDELLGNRFDWRGAEDPAGDVVRRREPVIIADVSARFEHFRGETHGRGRVHGWMGVPLLFGERLIGMLTLDKLEEDFYTAGHARMAQAFATQAATAIENARLFDETQLRLAETQAAQHVTETLFAITQVLAKTVNLHDIFEVILSELQQVVPYDSSSVQVIQNNRLVIVGGRGFENLQALLGLGFDLDDESNPSAQVVRTKRQQVFGDVSRHPHFMSQIHGGGRIRGWIGAPLIFGDRVIGVITLDKFEPDFYNEHLAELALAFAAQAATAIENAHLFETERLARQQAEALSAAAQALSSTLSLRQVFDLILSELRKMVPYDSCSVQQLDGDTMVIVGGHGFPNLDELLGNRFDWRGPDDPAGEVVRRREPVIIADVSARFEHFQDETHGRGRVHGWMGVPLLFGERLIGMLTLDKLEEDFYSADHARMAQAFATQAATAIENARLFETERLAREQSETLRAAAQALSSTLSLRQVFEIILSELRKVVPYDSCSVQQLDGDMMVIVGGQGFPNLDELLGNRFDWRGPDDPAGAVVRQREPVIISDVSARFEHFQDETHGQGRVHGWMGVPLLFGERMTGMLTLDKLEANFYTPDQAQVALAFATQAATAIENARLFDETQRLLRLSEDRAAELGAIGRVSQALLAEAELDSTIQLIGSQVQDIFRADSAYVALLDPDTHLLRYPYQTGQDVLPLRLAEAPTRQIVQTGEPVLIRRVLDDGGGANSGGHENTSYLGVPLKTNKGIIGVIGVQNSVPAASFTDDSLRLLTTIAANAGSAVQNAQLFSEALENLRQVEILTNAASAIEQSAYEPAMIESVARRSDALGELARVFRKMADEVRLREQRLKRQLQQLQLDIEEKQLAKAETVAVYLPMDRRQALAAGRRLPEHTTGAALFADVSGFTALTGALANELGLQRGAEEVIRQLNRVYTALIDEVHHYGGSVINFSGDAITCWFDELDAVGVRHSSRSVERAAACALVMQTAMQAFAVIARPDGKTISLSIKVAVVAGPARRLLVGEGTAHQIDVLAGRTLSALSNAEHHAERGEIIVAAAGVSGLAETISISEWRDAEHGVMTGLRQAVAPAPWAALAPEAISPSQAQPWMLPAVYEKVRAGQSDMLSELREVAALFLKFGGLDYDGDPQASARLDAFIAWVEQVIAPHHGAIIQLTVGDKGSYLYVVFGAPSAHPDDAVQAVLAALELAALPAHLANVTHLQIGLAFGQMRVGAYGGSAHRTYGAIGDKTNLAARLMQAATPALFETAAGAGAAILCDDAIWAAAQTQVAFETLPPIRVKGKARPIPVFRPLHPLGTVQAGTGMAPAQAQLFDRLSPAEQLTLKVASVIGQHFTLAAVSAVYPETHEAADLDTYLRHLAYLGLIRPSHSAGQAAGYAFQDALTHAAAYNLMLFAQRRQLHRAVAELMEQTNPNDPPYPEIAHHWQAADEIPKAVHYLEKAGEQARAGGDYAAATRFFNDALAMNR